MNFISMQETLKWWWAYYISKREVEKMKKNMKKVPIIQKKSELYHKNQNKEAELFINYELENYNIQENDWLIQKDNNKNWNNKSWLKKLIYSIKNLFLNIFDGN